MALDEILAHKRAELAARKAARSLESVLARCTLSRRSLAAALKSGRPGFLLEIKFASPSSGMIRAGSDLEPVLASYGRHADAVSVLTDARFFGGSLERLAEVRTRLDQPLLCKDFMLDPYQVAEAREHGADAILLILAAVDEATWRACVLAARRFGMEVVTEAHDAAEVARAVSLGATIIGINNRNLRTLQVDTGTAARLAPLVPADRLVIAESGIESRDDVAALRPHVDAFLVGSALMREAELDRAVRALVYGRTKVCGLTRAEDARAAWEAGATHGGLIFATGSPRRVTLEQARETSREIPLAWVGVYADQQPEQIAAAARSLTLSAVQLHGNESPGTLERVRALLPTECQVWKAARVRDRIPLRSESGADRMLLDGPATAQTFDWSLLTDYSERSEVVLAGGLQPDNVAEAAALGSFALDVSSGVEASPGRKDPARLREFLQARRRLPGRGAAGR